MVRRKWLRVLQSAPFWSFDMAEPFPLRKTFTPDLAAESCHGRERAWVQRMTAGSFCLNCSIIRSCSAFTSASVSVFSAERYVKA